MKKMIQLLFCSLSVSAFAQQPVLTLQECYTLAVKNYPLTKQRQLIEKTADYLLSNIERGYLPQLHFNAQATYQSAVTEIPISLPGFNPPIMNKDQYKVVGEVNQVIYDGGLIGQQKELQRSNQAVAAQQLETELYKLKDRINQLFFGALLIDEQLKQNALLINDLELGLNKIQAAITYGTALKSNGEVLKADILKNKQRAIELKASKKAYLAMLSLFVQKEIDEHTILKEPMPLNINKQINRPERLFYTAQLKNLEVQNKLISAKALPKFNFYFQGGLGRPGLNMLSNKFDAFYIGGFRLTWSPSVFYTMKKDRALIELDRSTIALNQETFLFNTNLTIKQQDADLEKYNALLETDNELIALRQKIKAAAVAQLENGVINANDYLREVNAEDQARQNKALHHIQMLLAQYSLQTTTGNLTLN